MTWLVYWLLIGLGAYLHAVAVTKSSFRHETVGSLLRGVLGFILWPFTLYLVWERKR